MSEKPPTEQLAHQFIDLVKRFGLSSDAVQKFKEEHSNESFDEFFNTFLEIFELSHLME